MQALPQGVVTFLFSDVEGSTRLANDLGDAAWAKLLEAHRRLMRQAFGAHGGREVDTQGDAFFVAFERATDAVAAALAGQRALASHPWPDDGRVCVRMGLHTGEALTRGDGYVGHDVHRGSRICAAAHGKQIVLSQTCADIVRASLPLDVALTDLGEHRLKDFENAQRLFQLSATGQPSQFPPLRSLASPHNLPAERSSFVGRDEEIVAVQSLLTEHRLVTLTGIGGSGKTRLAVRVGALELARFADGVFFIDLAPVSSLDAVVHTVAKACALWTGDAMGGGGLAAVERLLATLAQRKCLLLVDNCEHLTDVSASLVDQILARCADVVILATSREALGVEGEQLVQVPSLAVPDEAVSGGIADSMHLFSDRARAVKRTFELDAQNQSAVAEICRRLDGIPLAIEFAAARVGHLSASQIAERLGDRFHLLTGGRGRIQRQQTLGAALDWSHDLLDTDEQAVFRRLAVFPGVFRLDAAESVCTGEGIAAERVLNLLGSLVSKSLVTTVGDEAVTRYRLLETVRMYASDKLSAAGETARIRSRHRDWYLRWLEDMTLEELSFSPSSLRAVGSEIDNLRVAAEWCVDEDRPDLLARLVIRLYGFWVDGNPNEEGRRWLEYALHDDSRLSAEERVACNAVLAAIATLNHEVELAVRHATRAIDTASGAPSPYLATALGLRALGTSIRAAGQPHAAAHLVIDMRHDSQAAMDMAQSSLQGPWRAFAQLWAAGAEANVGNLSVAAQGYGACIESSIAIGKPYVLWFALAELSGAQHLLGESEAALATALRFLTLLEPVTSLSDWQRHCAVGLMPALFAGGQRERANQVLCEMAPAVRRNGMRLAVNHLLIFAAVVEYLDNHPDRAGRLFGAARHLSDAQNMANPFSAPSSYAMYVRYLPLVRSALGPEEAHLARESGFAMTLDDAIAYTIDGPGRASERQIARFGET